MLNTSEADQHHVMRNLVSKYFIYPDDIIIS